jgi:hypothetical protein
MGWFDRRIWRWMPVGDDVKCKELSMRSVLSAIMWVSLLAGSSQGVINVKLTADNTVLAAGETTTVRVWAQGTASGIFSLGGSITASGPAVLTSNAGTFGWVSTFSPTSPLAANPGAAGAGGGWADFGSSQTNWNAPDGNYGKSDYVEVASYTVTAGNGSGLVSLSFASATISGFKPLEVNSSSTFGAITGVSIRVTNPSAPPLAGDIDQDGLVSILDVLRLARAYGSRQGDPNFDAACDLNGDGQVDMGDVLILANNFGKTN